jgi:polar amino acid transport system substrate-binding protein
MKGLIPMKNITRLLALVLVAVMACGFVGCGATDSNKYIIYSDNAFAPFEYLDKATNTYVGVDMDIMAAIAKDQGFEYEMKNEGFDAAMGAVQAGQADGMIAGMTINDARKENYDFSEGYFEDGSILVTAKDSTIAAEADLAGKKIAAKKGTTSTDYAESIKDKYGFTMIYFEDSPAMYQAVLTGSADACFEDRSVIGYAIKEQNMNLKTVGEVVKPAYYGFAVKKGQNAELIEKFNAGLKNIKANGEYEKILAKYGY